MTDTVDLFGRPDGDRRAVQQLPLPLGWRASETAPRRLLIGQSNRQLFEALLDWQSWASPVALLMGPARSGKSLLAEHVAKQTGTIQIVDHPELADEKALFHASTAALAHRSPLLVVGRWGWRPKLADLATRMAAAQDFSVPDPDSELLAALLARRAAEQGLPLSAEVAAYVAQRIERSFPALDSATGILLNAALTEGRALSLPFVRSVLGFSSTDDVNAVAA